VVAVAVLAETLRVQVALALLFLDILDYKLVANAHRISFFTNN
jgi:hypothetical protein